MKQVLENKIRSMVASSRDKAIENLKQLADLTESIEDFIIPSDKITFHANEKLYVMTGITGELELHKNAVNQFCEKLNIPNGYIQKLMLTSWGRELIKKIFADHNINMPRDKYLFRTIGNNLRGVLSQNYKRYDSFKIYQEFLKIAEQWNAIVFDVNSTETRGYIDIINPTIYETETPNNGILYRAFGARLQNSDFGNGALSLSLYELNPVCMNGLVTQKLMKSIHLGKEIPDDIELSERTIKLQTDLKIELIKDFGKYIFTGAMMRNRMKILNKASETMINLDVECEQKLPKIGIHKDEILLIRDNFIGNDPENGVQGKATLLKLVEAITAVARDIKDQERKKDLETIAGEKVLGRLNPKNQSELQIF